MKKKEVDFYLAIEWRYYVRSFGYREFVSAVALALFTIAIQDLLEYYSKEGWIESLASMSVLVVVPMILVGHLIYRIEHRRSNNYIGRNFHDWLFLLMLGGLNQLIMIIHEGEYVPLLNDAVGGLFFAIMLLLMFLEALVALLKFVLRLFGWRPF